MAKKKNVVISTNELEPTVLATMNNKKGGLIWLILLFALFIGVVYFLPQITEWYENYKKGTTGIPTVNNNTDKDENNSVTTNDEKETEITKYNLSDSLVIKNEYFSINNFMFLNNHLTFAITNLKSTEMNLKDKNYYLNIFSNDDTLLKRIKIAEEVFAASETKNYDYLINSQDISYFTLVEMTEEEYPNVVLNLDDNDLAQLKCVLNDETIYYNFKDNKLLSINDVYKVSNLDTEYQTKVNNYQNIISSISSDGVTTNANSSDEYNIFTILIDLKTANVNSLNNKNYYSLNTLAKVINFEMEARDYNCE